MFEHILLPTDFSAVIDAQFAAMRTLARRYGSTIHLVHVDEERALGMHSSDDLIHFMNDVDARRKEWMEQLTESLEGEGFPVNLARLEGVASEEICRYAAEHGIGVIVIGTRGHSSLEHVLLGSTSRAVLRSAPCPVLSVNLPSDVEPPDALEIGRILFPTDFSKASVAGLATAAQLARDFEVGMELLHVLKAPTFIPAIPGEPPFYVPRQAFATAHERSAGRLNGLVASEELAGIDVGTAVQLAADTADGIVSHARDAGCGLIVIPRGGRGALHRILFGRVVAHVVKLSPFPVLSFAPTVV